MIELDLLGVGADGETLVFTDANGERYSVQITDELRGSVRRDRPVLESVPAPGRAPLRPRDIQALLRAGASPTEIACDHGLEVSQVQKWASPVEAEKEFALARALASTIGADSDSPRMGDLVVDRLAARGVDPTSLSWSARREEAAPWQICLTFIQGAAEHGAHWTLTSAGHVEAIDQEAKWLTETISQTPSAAIFTPLPAQPPACERADAADVRAREALLDQLNAARGKRQEIDIDQDDEDEGADLEILPAPYPAPYPDPPESVSEELGQDEDEDESELSLSAQIYSLAGVRSKEGDREDGRPEDAEEPTEVDTAEATAKRGAPLALAAPAPEDSTGAGRPEDLVDDALPGLDPQALAATVEETKPKEEPSKKRSRRRSVPSWDEIVFGSRP
ncbi:DUF3071 domain-containing protein [Schaalia sp. 19OD2882]|uniref:septation protein SepH n=1 Tax=Schaalia sp. 19OD2882 TaxID=2794089 RepID=UPI001C1EAA9D|nr:septation protein SepH [Schaalia sp. 19OD2882]QWW20432.1 DUF3071 domain-containing protein [Schaalia sp. 19OD2882]